MSIVKGISDKGILFFNCNAIMDKLFTYTKILLPFAPIYGIMPFILIVQDIVR